MRKAKKRKPAGAAVRILVVGEGPGDIGDYGSFKEPGSSGGYLRGLLEARYPGAEILARKVSKLSKKLADDIDASRAAGALALAGELGCQLLVFARDVDRDYDASASSREASQKTAAMNASIAAGFSTVQTTVAAVAATPCRMMEAWALGDPAAIVGVFRGAKTSALPKLPEQLWGKVQDPTSNYPKHVLRRVAGAEPHRGHFYDLGYNADPETLAKTCPQSFPPFANALPKTLSHNPT